MSEPRPMVLAADAPDDVERPPWGLAEVTQARVFQGRAGTSYTTRTLASLRADHAIARDAVRSRVDLDEPVWAELRQEGLIEVTSRATNPLDHLARPDLGRRLSEEGARQVLSYGTTGADLQIVLGDGLSAQAVTKSGPELAARLRRSAAELGWTVGTPLFVRHCRVGVMNDIGDLLRPRLVVLLIGERPGLRTADGLSAYLAHRPVAGRTDADRNLISNIHDHGVQTAAAAERVLRLLIRIAHAGHSGVALKESTNHPKENLIS